MVRFLRATVAVVALSMPIGAAQGQFIDEQQRQAQCELSAIGSTRSRVAIDWIRTACNRLAVDTGFMINENSRQFHTCLVRYLSGVQNDSAAAQVINSCRTAYPP